MYMVLVGYMPGSEINIYDEANGRNEKYEFSSLLNEAIEIGAKVLWETYKVFVIHDMVFASVVVDVREFEDGEGVTIMNFNQDSTGFPNKERKQAVEAHKNRKKRLFQV